MTSLEQAVEEEVERRVAARLEELNAVRPRVLTVDEAAKELRLSRSTVYKMITEGELVTANNPRRVLIPQSEVDRLNAAASAA